MPDIFKLTPRAPVHGCGCYKSKPLSGLTDFTSSPALMGLVILGVAAVAYFMLSGSSSPSYATANRRKQKRIDLGYSEPKRSVHVYTESGALKPPAYRGVVKTKTREMWYGTDAMIDGEWVKVFTRDDGSTAVIVRK